MQLFYFAVQTPDLYMVSSKSFSRFAVAFLFVILIIGLTFVKYWVTKFNSAFLITFPDKISTVIMGDSHAEACLNPAYIENSISLALSSEKAAFTYYKLRNVIEHNPQVHKVILAYSNHSLFVTGDSGAAEMMHRYHNIIDQDFYSQYFKYEGWNAIYYSTYLIDSCSLPFGLINDIYTYMKIRVASKPPYVLGGFQESNKSLIGNTKCLKSTVNRQYYNGSKPRNVSQLEVLYLNKIIRLCNDNKLKLYLINTPVHKDYYQTIPKRAIQVTNKLASLVVSENVTYIDKSNMNIPDDYWSDYDHLNGRGAVFFSQIIKEQINLSK